uniref:RING-type domain-containing protein n=1 Tax=Monopterus albus TaxID=43700 RepID=A0A3Q3IUT2_MONAL
MRCSILFSLSLVHDGFSDGQQTLVSKRGGPFKMEELALTALLECPLCLEQLDVSAKVLPCQHTFCLTCLQKQEAASSQLFCPECGTFIPVRTVEELPANLLLVQILEALQGSTGPISRYRQIARYAVPVTRGTPLSAPASPSWLIGWCLSSCLPACLPNKL